MDRREKLDQLIETTIIEAVNEWKEKFIHEVKAGEFIVTNFVAKNNKLALVKVLRNGPVRFYCNQARYFVSVPS